MMNNQPARPAQAPQAAPDQRLGFWRRVKNVLTRQWGWKLGSLVLAICLWGVLISQDSALPRDKVIDGVRVTVTNAASMRSNGYIITSGLEDVDTVSVRVRVPQKNYASVNASNFTARLDLNQVQKVGEQTLKVTVTSLNTSQYGTVQDVLTPDIRVVAEEYGAQSRVPVEVRRTGEVPEGCFAGALTRDTEYVDLAGPKSIVEKAVRCVVNWDQSALSPERTPNTASLAFILEDAQGEALDAGNVTVTYKNQTISRIGVSQEVYDKARVPVDKSSLYSGTPAEGYAVSGVRISPEYVTIAGSKDVIAPYLEENSAFYTYEQVNIDGQSRTTNGFLTLRSPQSVEYISTSSMNVVVTILPEAFVNPDESGAGNP